MDTPELRVLSLFSGIGGLDLGLHRAARRLGFNVRPVVLVEGEAFGAAVLAARMEEARLAPCPIWLGDVREFPASEFRGCVDLVVCGWPCQPASVAGKRAGQDDERWLWPEVARVLDVVQPRWFFGENVPGLLTVGDCSTHAVRGTGFGEVLGSLASLGFDAEWTSVRASDVGAPHRRERVFILASRAAGSSSEPMVEPRGVDDPERARLERADEREPSRCGAAGPGERVADSPNDHRGRRERAAEEGTRPHGERRRGPPGGGAELADRDGGRLPQQPERYGEQRVGLDGQPGRDALRRGPPLWPPRPDDADGWRYVLERWPWLAPAINPGWALDDAGSGRYGSADEAVRAGRDGSVGAGDARRAGSARIPDRDGLRVVETDLRRALRSVAPGRNRAARRRAAARVASAIVGKARAEAPESAVRPLAHGLRPGLVRPPRIDTLRAAGNAVVPAQACEAFLHLFARLTKESRP